MLQGCRDHRDASPWRGGTSGGQNFGGDISASPQKEEVREEIQRLEAGDVGKVLLRPREGAGGT